MRSKNLLSLLTSGKNKSWEFDSKWFWNMQTNSINRSRMTIKENNTNKSLYRDHCEWGILLAKYWDCAKSMWRIILTKVLLNIFGMRD